MVAAWPEPVERVSSFLREAGAEARIEAFADNTLTAAEAASAVGCDLDQIVKSLVLVSDSGPGIPARHLTRLYEPFFTTKETGLGLGLPVSQRIAHDHGGTLRATNRPQGGPGSRSASLLAASPVRERSGGQIWRRSW